ncbi:MAG: trp operon repressor [Chitinispirillales bacterium]|nr:trp operon repressor [Chitinispirillales bacterium]
MHRNTSKPKAPPAQELIRSISAIGDSGMLQNFFTEIFTATELRDLELRWELMKRLRDGIPQRKIARELGVSLCKITRGAKIVKDPNSMTNRILAESAGGIKMFPVTGF